ncbi:CLUMA_CG019894, isoform A [Clunio marinus]|uniref:CLUMA_CG019894, isoform A n=1 Tax=Clunio marinus TaxID=568069 RepID=A0A1J1J2P7_9DIPT|nr:CLUMA_CG019894, isoform A [Clunio marinus]
MKNSHKKFPVNTLNSKARDNGLTDNSNSFLMIMCTTTATVQCQDPKLSTPAKLSEIMLMRSKHETNKSET